MTSAVGPRVFDFAKRRETLEQYVALTREFAAAPLLRSATVDELELDSASYRRPVRPEDLSFIDFSKPVTAAAATRLPFLASQRLLMAANEQRMVRWPRGVDSTDGLMPDDLHALQARERAARIVPFLEDFAFDFLEPASVHGITPAGLVTQLERVVEASAMHWRDALRLVGRAEYQREGLRFLLIQEGSLADAKRDALRIAAASGFFEIFPEELHPRLESGRAGDDFVATLAPLCGVNRGGHAYWQFYLASSLARCNLLHAFLARPSHALRLIGAAYVARADWLTFRHAIADVACEFGAPTEQTSDHCKLRHDFRNVIDIAARWLGDWAVHEVAAGVATAASLSDHARFDQREQLRWLSSLERYRQFAHVIDERIRQEHPNIDRETFVEPREMCSTTHVHDDHRLVVIESGDMVFWGNLGMTLRLKPGEMVLVPQGRLHGSSIESAECVYHQPIIPDAWIETLLATSEG